MVSSVNIFVISYSEIAYINTTSHDLGFTAALEDA